ncbi:MAG TPA: IS1 family transposase [Thermoanaerobaculia bacterium]|jgi:IS1 family transposase|nr:IS1 family transposase [Thermoanaerobaculia bacterium]
MNRMDPKRQAAIIAALVEGVGIRSTCRMTGASKGAVTKLIADLGPVCAKYMDEAFHDLPCKTLELDEIWAFCYAKAKNVPQDKQGTFGYGDVWTFTAIDADTKLIPSFMVGSRDAGTATEFCQDLASRLACRPQITTDGLKVYIGALEDAFNGELDYAMLQKIYAAAPGGETRYSPAECTGCQKTAISGNPDPKRISTSYVERANLSMRMGLRRYTRLTNGHSKKLENHCAALSIFFMHYNFARVHSTIRCSPAMAAGVTSHLWSVADIVKLLPVEAPAKRGPYKKRPAAGQISK